MPPAGIVAHLLTTAPGIETQRKVLRTESERASGDTGIDFVPLLSPTPQKATETPSVRSLCTGRGLAKCG